jgi:hypothetical protein
MQNIQFSTPSRMPDLFVHGAEAAEPISAAQVLAATGQIAGLSSGFWLLCAKVASPATSVDIEIAARNAANSADTYLAMMAAADCPGLFAGWFQASIGQIFVARAKEADAVSGHIYQVSLYAWRF